MKPLFAPLIAGLIVFCSACSSTTEMDQTLEHNFSYQCAIKFYKDVDGRKVPIGDVEKVCAAAWREELEKGRTTGLPNTGATANASPVPSASPEVIATPAKEEPALDDTDHTANDEVKPETNPSPARKKKK